jgi:undecaprenyl-diphosphatase
VIYFNRLNPFERNNRPLWIKLILATLPAAAIGFAADTLCQATLGADLDALLFVPQTVAAALIIYGIAFILIENARGSHVSGAHAARGGRGKLLTADDDARVQSVEDLSWGTALGIGAFQVLSIVPGTSRSGSTIIGGLLLGCSRAVAAEFTFYLAIPVMVGASGLRLVKYFLKGNTFTGAEFAILGVGCVVAFVVSILAIRFLMGFVKKHDFKPFGWYRIALGVAVIAYFVLAG